MIGRTAKWSLGSWGHRIQSRRFGGGTSKTPFEVLSLDPKSNLTLKSLNKRYAELVKIYHPDVNPDPKASEIFQEIQQAYTTLKPLAIMEADTSQFSADSAGKSGDMSDQQSKQPVFRDEEALYLMIFGKKYDEDPEFFYLKENAERREIYISKVEAIRNLKIDRNTFKPNHTTERVFRSASPTGAYEQQTPFVGMAVFALMALGFLGYVGLNMIDHSKSVKHHETTVKQSSLSDDKMEELRLRGWERENYIIQKKVDKVYSELPDKIKVYPKKAPSATDMLLDYTIYKDLRFYSTFLTKFTPELKSSVEKGEVQVPRSSIEDHKTSDLVTLALEAERVLKNIYVDITQVRKEIETKHYFDPPGVFFRFNGSIYFKIRKSKPMNPNALSRKKRIVSLFELYFDVTSPIPYRHPLYKDLKVGDRYISSDGLFYSNGGYGGYVKFNTFPIPEVTVKDVSKQRNVFVLNPDLNSDLASFYDDMFNQIYHRNHLARFHELFKGEKYNTHEKTFEPINLNSGYEYNAQ
jgi:DnaJ domain